MRYYIYLNIWNLLAYIMDRLVFLIGHDMREFGVIIGI